MDGCGVVPAVGERCERWEMWIRRQGKVARSTRPRPQPQPEWLDRYTREQQWWWCYDRSRQQQRAGAMHACCCARRTTGRGGPRCRGQQRPAAWWTGARWVETRPGGEESRSAGCRKAASSRRLPHCRGPRSWVPWGRAAPAAGSHPEAWSAVGRPRPSWLGGHQPSTPARPYATRFSWLAIGAGRASGSARLCARRVPC